jgi:hypothetical protein
MILVGLVVSFVPAGICVLLQAGTTGFFAVALVIAISGTYFLPGVLLTLMTSGSVVNLRPDRVMKSIGICGSRYISPLLAWIVAASCYGLGQVILVQTVMRWLDSHTPASWLNNPFIAYPLLCVGVAVMHYFSFELGMLYRRHHAAFPWLFQRHEPVNHIRRTAAIRTATNARAQRLPRK